MFKKSSLIYFLPALCAILAYFPSLQYGFAQDDFINLYISQASNLSQFLNFFNPNATFPDLFFFRPLTTQVWFFLNQLLFGLNAIPFHIEALILHIGTSYLFFIAVKILWQKKNIALLSSILYSLSAVHFLSLYYISTFQELGKTFFMLLCVIFFARKLYLISALIFIGALLSKEGSIILPVFLMSFELFRRREENLKLVFKETLVKSLPLWLILIGYLILRWVGLGGIFSEGGYSISFSIFNILQNLKWYIIWSFGLPEIISTYPNLSTDSLLYFVRDFRLALPIVISFMVFLGSILMSGKPNFSLKTVLLLSLLFLIPILPTLPLYQHKYPQYLGLSAVAVLPLIPMILTDKKLVMVGLSAFVILQFLSIELTRQTHWSTHRAQVTKYYYDNFSKEDIKEGTTVIFSGTYQELGELSVDLAKDYALKNWFPGKINEVRYLESGVAEEVAETINNKIVKKVEVF